MLQKRLIHNVRDHHRKKGELHTNENCSNLNLKSGIVHYVSKDFNKEVNRGRICLLKNMDRIIAYEGFDRKHINKKSFYELEEEMHLDHYNLYGSSRLKTGYLPVSNFSRKRIEENIKYILKD